MPVEILGMNSSAFAGAEFLVTQNENEAKEMSDVSISYEKTMNNPKTWYLRGLIYMALDTSASFSGVSENSLQTAISSFNKNDISNQNYI